MSLLELAAKEQLAVVWPAGKVAEREKLVRRLQKRAKGDKAVFRRLWHKFKALLRLVDASKIETYCDLKLCIRSEVKRREAPKNQAAAWRHKQTIITVTPEQVRREAAQAEAGKSFAGKSGFHPKHCEGFI